jgi:hypothetical protein
MRCLPFVAFGIFLLVRPAYGYIDPGTGSYVLQTLLAILFAAAYTLKIYWHHVAGFFRYKFSRKRRDEKPEK